MELRRNLTFVLLFYIFYFYIAYFYFFLRKIALVNSCCCCCFNTVSMFFWFSSVHFSSVAQSCPTLCDPMDCNMPGFPVHHQLPELAQIHIHQVGWCHPTISSSVVPFSSCLQSFPASGSFPVSQFFASGGQSIAASASASVLPMNIQDWLPLGLNGWISS